MLAAAAQDENFTMGTFLANHARSGAQIDIQGIRYSKNQPYNSPNSCHMVKQKVTTRQC